MSATLTTPELPLVSRPTLEDTLERAWREALAERVTQCPVCRAPMTVGGAEAECSGCGSRLS